MTKELEALNRIKKIEIYKEEDYYDPDDERTIGLSGYEYQGSVEEEYANEIEIIEIALKREDSIEITAIDIEQENQALCKENKKLKQLLELIQKHFKISKPVGVSIEKNAVGVGGLIQIEDLTIEDYSLLKEWLR